MRVTVIGASGGIGREVVRQAIAADHEVTAVIRDSARSGAVVREWERVPVGGPGRLHVATRWCPRSGRKGARATWPSTRGACGPR
jgi:uncharacterized protein YbjT (DUF2867 family)